jgi:hypothetical protein
VILFLVIKNIQTFTDVKIEPEAIKQVLIKDVIKRELLEGEAAPGHERRLEEPVAPLDDAFAFVDKFESVFFSNFNSHGIDNNR